MMKHEFEQIAKMEVTSEVYESIEKLYMESSLDKYEFIKSMKSMLKSIVKPVEKKIVTINFCNAVGSYKTPNGCWYLTVKAEVIKEQEVDIKTGIVSKMKVRKIENSFDMKYDYDYIDYEVEFLA